MKTYKEIERKYYKYEYIDWEQPVLTSNDSYGTLTGNGDNGNYTYWKCFDGVIGSVGWITPTNTTPPTSFGFYLKWELPVTLKITNIRVYHGYIAYGSTKTVNIYADNESNLIGTYEFPQSSDNSLYYDFPIDNVKTNTIIIALPDRNSGTYPHAYYYCLGDVIITAREETIIESTESDYDFYKDLGIYKLRKRVVRKYYKYVNTKQPNVTTVGSPTITNGVVSSMTTSNYVKLSQTFNSSELTEAQIVFSTGSNITTAQGLFLGTISDNTSSLGIYNGGLYLINKVANSYPSYVSLGLPLEINTKYYFKFTQNGTSIIPYLSTDGETYNQGTRVTRSKNFGVFIGYGLSNDLTNTPMLGTIDLNESYIKINNKLWWRGTIIETQQATQSDYDYYVDEPVCYAINI